MPEAATPKTTLAANAQLSVICENCQNVREVDLNRLIADGRGDTPRTALRFRYARCGSRRCSPIVSGKPYR